MTMVNQSPSSLATATHPPSLLHALSYIARVQAGFPLKVRLVFKAIGAIEIRVFGEHK